MDRAVLGAVQQHEVAGRLLLCLERGERIALETAHAQHEAVLEPGLLGAVRTPELERSAHLGPTRRRVLYGCRHHPEHQQRRVHLLRACSRGPLRHVCIESPELIGHECSLRRRHPLLAELGDVRVSLADDPSQACS